MRVESVMLLAAGGFHGLSVLLQPLGGRRLLRRRKRLSPHLLLPLFALRLLAREVVASTLFLRDFCVLFARGCDALLLTPPVAHALYMCVCVCVSLFDSALWMWKISRDAFNGWT